MEAERRNGDATSQVVSSVLYEMKDLVFGEIFSAYRMEERDVVSEVGVERRTWFSGSKVRNNIILSPKSMKVLNPSPHCRFIHRLVPNYFDGNFNHPSTTLSPRNQELS